VPFNNPVVGGGGALVRTSIHSPNYAAGSAGWTINRDGSVEFNNATIRGSLSAGGGAVLLNSGGLHIEGSNIQMDINTTAAFLVRQQPLTGSEAEMAVNSSGGLLALKPADVSSPAVSTGYANLYTANAIVVGTSVRPRLILTSPGVTSPSSLAFSQIELNGQSSNDGTDNSYIKFFNGNNRPHEISLWIAGVTASGSTGAIGATETVAMTVSSATFRAFRAYRMIMEASFTSSVAAQDVLFRLRKTNTAGQQIQVARFYANLAAVSYSGNWSCGFIVGSSDVTATMVLTATGGATWNAVITGAGTSPRSVTIYDVGDSTSYANWATLV
jgi:hypothetical protein